MTAIKISNKKNMDIKRGALLCRFFECFFLLADLCAFAVDGAVIPLTRGLPQEEQNVLPAWLRTPQLLQTIISSFLIGKPQYIHLSD